MSAILFRLVGEKVHGASTPDGLVFSVYDFIHVVCQNNGMYASQVWTHLNRGQFKFRMNASVAYQRNLPKKTKKPTPVMTMDELAILMEALGRRVSRDYDLHRKFKETFALFNSGDRSMLEETHMSPLFAAPAPKALAPEEPAPPVPKTPAPELEPEPAPEAGAKRMRDRDEVLFDLELQERQTTVQERWMTLQERQVALREKTLALQKTL